MKIEDKIEEIINRYWRDFEEYYSRYRYDDKENEFEMDKEIEEFLKSNNITYKIAIENGFDSCGYSNEFFAVAYWINGNLHLKTVVWEYY